MVQTRLWMVIGVCAASCGAFESGDRELEEPPVVGTQTQALSSYSNCRGGCPEGMLCGGHYGR